MSVDLTMPLEWKTADAAVLEDLQGNILKGHGREHTINLFVQFDANEQEESRKFVRRVGNWTTSAKKQLEETERFQQSHGKAPGDAVVLLLLSFAGFQALGIDEDKTPDDLAFQAGLKNRREDLSDPLIAEWDEHFREDIHAMIILADESTDRLEALKDKIIVAMPDSATLVGEEIGLAMRNTNNDGIEHFGYVDGRSQPLLLVEDIIEETDTKDGTHVWDPAFPLGQALVSCKGGTEGVSFGSYFVFRKLEQDVKGFKEREKAVATEMELPERDRELAGAMIVGRFEDGTPVVLHSQDGADNPVPNDFTYESDKKGIKCPFHAHIRKTNPRGESVGKFAADLDEERSHIMARRGITYGERVWVNNMPNTKLDEDHLPTDDVGLLFMAYQSDIGNQFEFTQINWANFEGFVNDDTGLDPVIGQGTPTMPLKQSRQWGKDDKRSFDFDRFVRLKGGEYFYAPCISFLKTI